MHCRSRRLTSKAETRAPAHSRAGAFACTSNFAAAGRTRGSDAGFPALMTIPLAEGNEHATTDQPTNQPLDVFRFQDCLLDPQTNDPRAPEVSQRRGSLLPEGLGAKAGSCESTLSIFVGSSTEQGPRTSGISGCAGCRSVWICVPRPLRGRLVNDLAKGQTGQARLR